MLKVLYKSYWKFLACVSVLIFVYGYHQSFAVCLYVHIHGYSHQELIADHLYERQKNRAI